MKFGQNCEIWSKLWNLVKIVKFGQNSEAEFKTNGLVKILKLNQNSQLLTKVGIELLGQVKTN